MRVVSSPPHRLARAVLFAAAVAWSVATLLEIMAPKLSAEVVWSLADLRVASPWLIVADVGVGVGSVSVLSLVHRRRRPPRWDLGGARETRLHEVQSLVDTHGSDTLAPFIVRPDKSFERFGETVIAYRKIGRTIVVSGDPVGPRECVETAFGQAHQRWTARGLRTVVYGAGADSLPGYRAAGMRVMCVGAEAVIDPATFRLEGRAIRKVRQSVQRVSKRGWTIVAVQGRDLDSATADEIEAVEQLWRAAHPQILGFAMSFGSYEHGARPDDLLVLARSPAGELGGVMRFLAHRGNLSLDTMRRVGQTPNGLNEALVCHALMVARDWGVAEVSLNYAGLAPFLLAEADGGRTRRLLRRLTLRALSHRFQLERLVRFNEKFGPEWRPRYLVYESRLALPCSILRVLQVEGYISSGHNEPSRRQASGISQQVQEGMGAVR